MKKILIVFVGLVMVMAFTGCTMTKQLAYFQNMDSISLEGVKMRPNIKIKPNDELTITVTSTDPEAARPFNSQIGTSTGGGFNSYVGSQLYSYIVDEKGNINFPVIGKINLVGKTRPEAEEYIEKLIKPYFAESENPVVKVRFSSFIVTVIGEVSGTRTINVSNERINIIEALAQAGDLSVYGKRPNILLIRENAEGEKSVARFNLVDAETLNSDYYYLQQNDIVYVEPQKAKARSADVNSYLFWTPITSALLALTSFIISLTK